MPFGMPNDPTCVRKITGFLCSTERSDADAEIAMLR